MAITQVGACEIMADLGGSTTTVTVNVPAGATAGDLLVWRMSGTTNSAMTAPTGWTTVGTYNAAAQDGGTFIRKVISGDTATSYSVTVPNGRWSSEMTCWRGVDPTTPQDVTAPAPATTSSGLVTPPSITPVTDGAQIVMTFGAQIIAGGTEVVTSSTNMAKLGRSIDSSASQTESQGAQFATLLATAAPFTPNLTSDVAPTRSTVIVLALRPAPGGGGGGTLYAVAGIDPATTTTTGATSARVAAAGSTPGTTTDTGSAGRLLPTSGIVTATTTTSGAASVIGGPQQYTAAGTSPATTSTSGTVGQVRAAATATNPATSSTTGGAGVITAGAGNVTASSDTTATGILVLPSGGTITIAADTNADAALLLAVAGTADAISGLLGAATSPRGVQSDISVTVGPSRQGLTRATVGPTRTAWTVGDSRSGSIAVAASRTDTLTVAPSTNQR